MVARLYAGDPCPDLADDPRGFVAEHAGKEAFAVESVERVGVGVADARRHDLDQNLAGFKTFEVHLDDLQRLLGLECDCGAGLDGFNSFIPFT